MATKTSNLGVHHGHSQKKTKVKEIKKEMVPLTSIEVLVLAGMDNLGILLMIRLLLAQNYLLVMDGYIQKEPLNMNEDVHRFQHVANINYLRFDHERKLMYRISEKEAQKSQAISHLQMTISTDTEYSSPTPHHPNELKIGTAIYLRVA